MKERVCVYVCVCVMKERVCVYVCVCVMKEREREKENATMMEKNVYKQNGEERFSRMMIENYTMLFHE